jgi:hypothetical protein
MSRKVDPVHVLEHIEVALATTFCIEDDVLDAATLFDVEQIREHLTAALDLLDPLSTTRDSPP